MGSSNELNQSDKGSILAIAIELAKHSSQTTLGQASTPGSLMVVELYNKIKDLVLEEGISITQTTNALNNISSNE